MKKIPLFASAVLVAALAGCASGTPAGPGTPQSISGTWKLSTQTDATGELDLADQAITLSISNKRGEGRAPCNGYGFELDRTATGPVVLTPGPHTMMACAEQNLMDVENRYLAAIDKVDYADLKGHTLVLSGKGVTLTYSSAD
ncbi:MAG: hypothetical protein JWQ12_396 [Glaciihabitans sp.]|nr:hypothetical protein [Glaciihabitans sp.]